MLLRCFFAFCLLAATTSSLSAAIVTYTDPAAFQAAIAGRTTSEINFDTAAAGTTIADGGVFGGVTFDYTWASGESLRVNDEFDTNSGSNYLGATSGGGAVDLLADDNNFTMTPGTQSSAVGLFVIAPIEPLDDDFVLSSSTAMSGAASVSLVTPELQTLADGSFVYFLGLVADDNEVLDPVNLDADAFAFGTDYRVDGIVFAESNITAVPEPTSLLLAGGCMLLIGVRRRRQ